MIQIKFRNKVIFSLSWKLIVYTLCFFMFFVIDQRIKTCSGLDGWLETFRDSVGIVMGIIIISHYRLKELIKWRKIYFICSAIFLITGGVAIYWGIDNKPFMNHWIIVLLNIGLYGFILIHTILDFCFEKNYIKLNIRLIALWLLMIILMIFSRSNYLWPFCYLIMFGCFYLSNYTKEEEENLINGVLNGAILAFCILQGLCFVFRPYDLVRYQGIYHNSNLNALFYVEVLAAVLIKLYYGYKADKGKIIQSYYFMLAGTVLSFIVLTVGRTAWLTAGVLVVLFLIILHKLDRKYGFIKKGFLFLVCVIISFPLCFGAIRYFPPVFHHPIWFWGEWSEERVHSWDAWNSQKYVELDEFINHAAGRLLISFNDLLEKSPFVMNVMAQEDSPLPYMEATDDTVLIRKVIYNHYAEKLNWTGHTAEEQGFLLFSGYFVGHAHNVFLQLGSDFGIPAMVLFSIICIIACIKSCRKAVKQKDVKFLFCLFSTVIVCCFGMFEYAWGSSSVSMILLFCSWRWLFREGN